VAVTHSLRDVLASKREGVITIQRTALVSEAASLMLRARIGALVVIDGPALVGVLSERDVLDRIVCSGRDPRTTEVGQVMTTGIDRATPDTTVEEAMARMTRKRQRHMPVVEGSVLRGIVSVGDLLKWVAEDLDRHVADLSTLIGGPFIVRSPSPFMQLAAMSHGR
jgi:CBS domain-containing protein